MAVFILQACAPGSPTATLPATAVPEQSLFPPQALDCESASYPCTFTEVSESVRVETERLASEAAARMADGATNDDIVAWLDSEAHVEEVEGDADSIRFRPSDGRAVWITRRTAATASVKNQPGRALAMARPVELAGSGSEIRASVTGPGRSERQAVVLSPYRWDFGDSDDGNAVAERLRELPDYAGGVTYAENATVDSSEVTVDDFKSWDDKQVVHVVSHGARLCTAGKCRAFVAAHALPGGIADLFLSTTRGLDLELEIGPTTPRFNVVLGADFFRDQYPGGLTDSVVFLNGCSTFGPGATDLADAIRGSGSVVLGWSRPVGSAAAQGASLAVYEELAGHGRPVGDALEHVGSLVTDTDANSTLTSTGRALGGDVRIREVVDFESAASGEPLAAGASVPIIGKSGDGVADTVEWRLQVDGIESAPAATAVVQVTIDGHAAAPVNVATGVADANDSWELTGSLALGVDISAPHPALFEATIALPDGGTSIDAVSTVLVAGSEPTPQVEAPLGPVARGVLTDRSEIVPGVERIAEAELVFTLSPDAGPRYFQYEVSGGTMTMSQSGTTTDGSCTHKFGPTEFELDSESLSGGFTIDMGSSPPTFSGSVTVTGPEIEVQQTCTGEYAYLTGPYGTRAAAVFIQVFSSEEPVVPVVDGRVSGSSLYGNRTFEISASE
jgi:hypothetical protein